jgi:hypothetical protein
LLACCDALRRLLETQARLRRGTAPRRYRQYDHDHSRIAFRDVQAIPATHDARWLAPFAIDVHEPARDGVSRLCSALEEAGAPEPLVESQPFGRFGSLHINGLSAAIGALLDIDDVPDDARSVRLNLVNKCKDEIDRLLQFVVRVRLAQQRFSAG